MIFKKYTLDQLTATIKTSYSIRQVLNKLGVASYGGNYHTIKKYITKYSIDISHFTGQGWSKGKSIGNKRDIQDYLTNQIYISSTALKERLLKDKIFERRCYKCNNIKWLERDIPLELHHIDGNRYNNSLDNLSILCPNCHALTTNYCGKNIVKKKKKVCKTAKKKINYKCCICGNNIDNGKYCRICYDTNRFIISKPRPNDRRVVRPEFDQLLNDIQQLGYVATGKKYRVSDNAIRKWVKQYQKVPMMGLEPIRLKI